MLCGDTLHPGWKGGSPGVVHSTRFLTLSMPSEPLLPFSLCDLSSLSCPLLLLSCLTCQQCFLTSLAWPPVTKDRMRMCRSCASHSLWSGIQIQPFFFFFSSTANYSAAVHKQTIDPRPGAAALLQNSRPTPDNAERRLWFSWFRAPRICLDPSPLPNPFHREKVRPVR